MKPCTHRSNHSERSSFKRGENKARQADNRYGIVLGGGDGTRLKSLTRVISGDERPKQFCNILGDDSLLDLTLRRVEKSICSDRLLISLTSGHEKFFDYLYDGYRMDQLAVQPLNLGTASAITYGLMKIYVRDPGASVAFFPSDHYVSDDLAFMEQVNAAFKAGEREPDKIVLLGIEPAYPESEYGWIEPDTGSASGITGNLHPVKRFWEKPDKASAASLMKRGCIWNSFVMAGRAAAFVSIIEKALPGLYSQFRSIGHILGSDGEAEALGPVYGKLAPSNFSHRVLEVSTPNLMSLKVTGVDWSDLGEPGRVFAALDTIGKDRPPSLATQAG